MGDTRNRILTFLTSRKTNYQFTFQDKNKYANAVLADLSKFCRANTTTFHQDARASAVLEGRREVWLRIQNYLNLSPEELLDLQRKE